MKLGRRENADEAPQGYPRDAKAPDEAAFADDDSLGTASADDDDDAPDTTFADDDAPDTDTASADDDAPDTTFADDDAPDTDTASADDDDDDAMEVEPFQAIGSRTAADEPIADDPGSPAHQNFPSIAPIPRPQDDGASLQDGAQDDGSAPQDDGTLATRQTGAADDDLLDEQALEDMQAFKTLEEQRKQKKRRKRVKIIVIIVACVLLLCGGLGWYATSQATKALSGSVTTDTVTKGTFTKQITASGSLAPYNTVGVTPTIEGVIDQVYVKAGDAVTQGQPLFTITNDSLDTAVDTAESQLDTAQNGVDQANLALRNAYDSYNAAVDAYNEAISQGGSATFDEATLQNAIDQAKLGVNSAEITLESAQKAYDDAVSNADKRNVTSPASGTITTMNAVSGASVASASSAGSLIGISDVTRMRITIQVNEADILSVALGQTASITFSAVPGYTASGTVTGIATSNTSSTGTAGSAGTGSAGSTGVVTYAVEIVIDSPDARLKPGMSATATITTKQTDDVLMVPIGALQAGEDGTYHLDVVTDQDTMATESRPVTVVDQDATTAVVEGDGIAEGDVVAETALSADATTSTGL